MTNIFFKKCISAAGFIFIFLICLVPISANASTLYFNAASDHDWANISNWWSDSGFSVQAIAIPTTTDSVIVSASVYSNSGSPAIISTLSVSGTSTYFGINATTTAGASFHNSSNYGGTLGGNAYFYDSSQLGMAILNGNGFFYNSSSNSGTIYGNASFYNSSTNNTGIYGNVSVYYPSADPIGGTVSGTVTYYFPSTLTTQAASNITATSATLNGTITGTGGSNATQSGFAYTTDSSFNSGVSTTTLGGQSGTVAFASSLSGLSCNKTYYFYPYATNADATAVGSTTSFSTLSCPISTPPPTAPSTSSEGRSASNAELASILAPGPATTAYLASRGVIPMTTPMFTANLSLGMTSPEVTSLQHYLNLNGFTVTSNGLGSLGNETNHFGALTKLSLIKFQKAHAIPASGYFGPITRMYINNH